MSTEKLQGNYSRFDVLLEATHGLPRRSPWDNVYYGFKKVKGYLGAPFSKVREGGLLWKMLQL